LPKDLMFIVPYRPGTLAALGAAIGGAGINIEGCSAKQFGAEGIIHLLVEDAAGARRAAEAAGFEVRGEADVVVAPIEDRPGALAETLRPLAEAGIDVNLVYLGTGGRVVIGTDDVARARELLGSGGS
jgi:hypothetical protein